MLAALLVFIDCPCLLIPVTQRIRKHVNLMNIHGVPFEL